MRDLDCVRITPSDERCGESVLALLAEAERQLAAFHRAVLSLHGPEEARNAAEDWLRELEKTDAANEPIVWRRIAQAATGCLATRLVDGGHASARGARWKLMRLRAQRLLQTAEPCEAQ